MNIEWFSLQERFWLEDTLSVQLRVGPENLGGQS